VTYVNRNRWQVKRFVSSVGVASQTNVIGPYILRKDVMNANRDLLKAKGISLGMGCIRYSKPEKIDFKVAAMRLKATQESTGAIID